MAREEKTNEDKITKESNDTDVSSKKNKEQGPCGSAEQGRGLGRGGGKGRRDGTGGGRGRGGGGYGGGGGRCTSKE